MKLPYENELYELRKWIDNTNTPLNMQFLHTPQEIQRVRQWINAITRGIQADYPFFMRLRSPVLQIYSFSKTRWVLFS